VGLLKRDGINVKDDLYSVMALFAKHKMSLSISPIAIWGERFLINTPLYQVGKTEQFDMSQFVFDAKYALPRIRAWQSVSEVSEAIIPDVREKSGYMLDGLTIQNPQDNSSTVLLFTQRLSEMAKKSNIPLSDYRKVVIINEVSQVYFTRLISTTYLSVEISKLGISAPPGITLHHLEEAFSDLCSMKFAKWWKSEMLRILNSTDEGYRLSRIILEANLASYFPMVPRGQIPSALQKMGTTEFSKLNTHIIVGYEENILPILSRVANAVAKK
jgi:hypothetical protein